MSATFSISSMNISCHKIFLLSRNLLTLTFELLKKIHIGHGHNFCKMNIRAFILHNPVLCQNLSTGFKIFVLLFHNFCKMNIRAFILHYPVLCQNLSTGFKIFVLLLRLLWELAIIGGICFTNNSSLSLSFHSHKRLFHWRCRAANLSSAPKDIELWVSFNPITTIVKRDNRSFGHLWGSVYWSVTLKTVPEWLALVLIASK